MYRKTFDLDWDFGVCIANHSILIGTKRVRESFDSVQNFRARIANHLIEIRTSERFVNHLLINK